jgi:hypothetical protein
MKAPFLLDHKRHDETGESDDTGEDQVVAFLPLRICQGEQVAFNRMAGVVNDSIDAAKAFQSGVDKALEILG